MNGVLKKIADSNLTIGDHTVNHSDLEPLKDRWKIIYEIMEDMQKLEKITGRDIHYFAYPTGTNNNTDTNLIKSLIPAGYKGAVTILSGFNTTETNPYLLHRDIVRAGMNSRVVVARVVGNCDAISFTKKLTVIK